MGGVGGPGAGRIVTAHYAIAPEIAWVDGADGGREESAAWIARLDNAELYELRDAAWLVWVLIADGICTVDSIRAEVADLHATIDFGEQGLQGFLDDLEQRGLVTRR
ncbi:hypothetical protein [Microbacterium sp. MMO-23]|uniref:hypothetical protein n=1 Tax=Microbacterium sp. MMO-23 TaxID=3081278 RepID=UPI0025EDD857|nr:hypothetical protein [uncultured Microbacterium sp.]